MDTARILIVDDDPWTQRMVSAVLAQAGHSVDIASDGWEGLIRVGRTRPDLVITEIKLPTTDGWSFVETLRSRPDSATVPVIFMSSFGTDLRPGRSFLPGRDDCLRKPFRLEQLEEKVRAGLSKGRQIPLAPVDLGPPNPAWSAAPVPADPRTLAAPGPASRPARPTRIASESRWPTILVGSLEQFSLSSVLIVLELERKSGALVLHGSTGKGRIVLRDGRVIRAHVENNEFPTGSPAVYELLSWSAGRFQFNAGVPDGEDEIGSSTSFLLMEGARLTDERNHNKKTRN